MYFHIMYVLLPLNKLLPVFHIAVDFLGYGVIIQMKSKNEPKLVILPNQSSSTPIPKVINETSTTLNSDLLSVQSPPLSNMSEQTSKPQEPSTPQSEISQKTSSKELNSNKQTPSSINVIPYEGDRIVVPFKQEKEADILPIVHPGNLDMLAAGENALLDIAGRKENENIVNTMEKGTNTVPLENSTVLQNTELNANNTIDLKSDIYVKVAFDVFMTWNPRMTDPTFPPRLNIIQLLNEAVSNQLYLNAKQTTNRIIALI